MKPLSTFKPTGKSGALFTLALVTFLTTFVIACAYGFVAWIKPDIYIWFVDLGGLLLTAAWGAILYFALLPGAAKATQIAKAQNPRSAALVAGLVGLTGPFVHWCAFSSLVVMEVVVLPADIFSFMTAVSEDGYAVLLGVPLFNWPIWLIEALGFGAAAALGAYRQAEAPFCEKCDVWAGRGGVFEAHLELTADQVYAELRKGNAEHALRRRKDLAAKHVCLTFHPCPSCDIFFLELGKYFVKNEELKYHAIEEAPLRLSSAQEREFVRILTRPDVVVKKESAPESEDGYALILD